MFKLFVLIFIVSVNLDASVGQPENPICILPLETGLCRAYFERYGYNVKNGQCEIFVYGGCQGNKNNFETMEECQATCEKNY